MIELVSADRCIACDKCVKVCPTDVFDRGEDGIPVLARREDCQTCFQCEANCPVDALYVAPLTHPLPEGSPARDEEHLDETGLLGSYRRHIGWGRGRTPGALRAVGPPLSPPGATSPSPPITS
ncbi:ferredoxin family protein [Streptomyces sp. YS415]|uniref:4Fe-4S dicluster domain-containing protein n=1 Tax=Streptomyces sp. YS415 TaxID=2944806 RepID=UPI002020E678|nr:ferredoxin family protein [Streptomyces sp. YS415]MCL7428072.1 ferredoxin family protein [Streptomyces sp. YS415]